MSVLVLSVFSQQEDHLCPRIHSIFYVKDVLLNITHTMKDIKRTANKIEQNIVNITLNICIYSFFLLIAY